MRTRPDFASRPAVDYNRTHLAGGFGADLGWGNGLTDATNRQNAEHSGRTRARGGRDRPGRAPQIYRSYLHALARAAERPAAGAGQPLPTSTRNVLRASPPFDRFQGTSEPGNALRLRTILRRCLAPERSGTGAGPSAACCRSSPCTNRRQQFAHPPRMPVASPAGSPSAPRGAGRELAQVVRGARATGRDGPGRAAMRRATSAKRGLRGCGSTSNVPHGPANPSSLRRPRRRLAPRAGALASCPDRDRAFRAGALPDGDSCSETSRSTLRFARLHCSCTARSRQRRKMVPHQPSHSCSQCLEAVETGWRAETFLVRGRKR